MKSDGKLGHDAMIKLVTFLTVVFLAVLPAGSVTYFVAPAGDDTASGLDWQFALRTISNAVAKADVTEIVLSNGTHFVVTNVYIDKAVTIRGMTTNRELAIVNGNFPDTINRSFYIAHSGVTLADLTITNGFADQGGGVYMTAGTLRNCLITGNTATNSGGGVFMSAAGTVMTNCAVVGNVASNHVSATSGGGVTSAGGMMHGLVVSNNMTTGAANTLAGGVYMSNGAILNNCDIVWNTCIGGGGGIYIVHASSVITNCLIAYNKVLDGNNHGGGAVRFHNAGGMWNSCLIGNDAGVGSGGAVHAPAGNGPIHSCMIISNQARFGGGARTTGATLIRNSLVVGNTATDSGGGLMWVDEAVNCTIVDNKSGLGGGGVRLYGSARLLNCIVYFNHSDTGAEHNWMHDGTDMTYTNSCTIPLTGLTGPDNIDQDPKFVSAPGYNFRLKGSSPCIEAGLNQAWMADAADLDGNPRIHDGGTVDIGAYECIPPPAGIIFKGW